MWQPKIFCCICTLCLCLLFMWFSTWSFFSHSYLTAALISNRTKLKISYWSESQPNISSPSPPPPPVAPTHNPRASCHTALDQIGQIVYQVKSKSFCVANISQGGCSPCFLSNMRLGLSACLSWIKYCLLMSDI